MDTKHESQSKYKGLEKDSISLGNVKPGEVKSETLYFDNGNKRELTVSAQVDIQSMKDSYQKITQEKVFFCYLSKFLSSVFLGGIEE